MAIGHKRKFIADFKKFPRLVEVSGEKKPAYEVPGTIEHALLKKYRSSDAECFEATGLGSILFTPQTVG